jgi:hypothetical protein
VLVLALVAAIAPARAEGVVMRQALVIVDDQDPAATWMRLSAVVTITQHLPPRLAIVEGEDAAIEALPGVPGVRLAADETAPAAALERLTDTERLFAEAWILGRAPKTDRRGEGLPWDAEGFQPPDGPRRRPEEP